MIGSLLYWLPIVDDRFIIVLITYCRWSVHYWLPIVDDRFIIVLITAWQVASQPIREMNIHEQATTFVFIKSIDLFFTMKGSDLKKIEFLIWNVFEVLIDVESKNTMCTTMCLIFLQHVRPEELRYQFLFW